MELQTRPFGFSLLKDLTFSQLNLLHVFPGSSELKSWFHARGFESALNFSATTSCNK